MSIDYSTTVVPYSELKSPELRGIAGNVCDRLIEAFTIDERGNSIGEAILYHELQGDRHVTFAIDDGWGANWYTTPTEPGQGPTDDDYDDAIREWLEHDREPDEPATVDAETPAG